MKNKRYLYFLCVCFLVFSLNLSIVGCFSFLEKSSDDPLFEIGVKYTKKASYNVYGENISWTYQDKEKRWMGTISEFNITDSSEPKNYSIKGLSSNIYKVGSRYLNRLELQLSKFNTDKNRPLYIFIYEILEQPGKISFTQNYSGREDFIQFSKDNFKIDKYHSFVFRKDIYHNEHNVQFPAIHIYINDDKKNNTSNRNSLTSQETKIIKQSPKNFSSKSLKKDKKIGFKFKDKGLYDVNATIEPYEWLSSGRSDNIFFAKLFNFTIDIDDKYHFIKQGFYSDNNSGKDYINIDKNNKSIDKSLYVFIHGFKKILDKKLILSIKKKYIQKDQFIPLDTSYFFINTINPYKIEIMNNKIEDKYGLHPAIILYFEQIEMVQVSINTLGLNELYDQLNEIATINLIKDNKNIYVLPIHKNEFMISIPKQRIPDTVLLSSYFGNIKYKQLFSTKKTIYYTIDIKPYIQKIYIKDVNGKPVDNAQVDIVKSVLDNNIYQKKFSCVSPILHYTKKPLSILKYPAVFILKKFISLPNNNKKDEDFFIESKKQYQQSVVFSGKSDNIGSISFLSWNNNNISFQGNIFKKGYKPVINEMIQNNSIITLPSDNIIKGYFYVKDQSGNPINKTNVFIFTNPLNNPNASNFTYYEVTDENGVIQYNLPLIDQYKKFNIIITKPNYYIKRYNDVNISELNNREINIILDSVPVEKKDSNIRIEGLSYPEKSHNIPYQDPYKANNKINNIEQQILILLEKTDPDLHADSFIKAKTALSDFLKTVGWGDRAYKNNEIIVASAYKDRIDYLSNLECLKNEYPMFDESSSMYSHLTQSIESFNNNLDNKKIIYIISSYRSYIAPPNLDSILNIKKLQQTKISIYFIIIGDRYPNILDFIAGTTGGKVIICNNQVDIFQSLMKIFQDIKI